MSVQVRVTAWFFQRNCKQESGMCIGNHVCIFLRFVLHFDAEQ